MMRKRRLKLIIGASILCLAAVGGCARNEYRTVSGTAWGTVYHITYCDDRDMIDSIEAQMRMIDASLSPFAPTSLISRINRSEDSIVNKQFADVFELSKQVNAVNPAFDPTLSPLINLWGFGYADGADDVPDVQQIDSALALVGIGECCIDPAGILHKKHSGMQFNFSAIAKGYGVDCIAAMLARNGIKNYMVEVGGEIALAGVNPNGQEWHIQVDKPVWDENGEVSHERLRLLTLTDCAVATSGNYRNYRDTSAGRVGHTISAVTGNPVTTDMLSATIIAPTCALADALATLSMALPSDEAAEALSQFPETRAIFVTTDSVKELGSATHP